MKRFLCLLLSLILLSGCGKSAPAAQESSAPQGPALPQGFAAQQDSAAQQGPAAQAGPAAPSQSATMPEVFSQDEYMLYQSVFYGDYGSSSEGAVEKQGVYATIYDAFNQCRRYYVWGYYDKTKCCDWQWEFVPDDPDALPVPGSLIRVTGDFTAAEKALDGYWIEGAKCATEEVFAGAGAEVNMAVMSCTLERVQMYNILYKPEEFEGKDFTAYGRLTTDSKLQDPYYDGSWQIGYRWDGDVPGLELPCYMTGEIKDGSLAVRSLELMES